MLSLEENELLTRVGPGTPMGSLLREYWQPALLSQEIPQADGPQVRVRLLGEELVAFRDTSGRIGLLAANCPHRGAPLYYGRNEEGGLRCVYHGWKFDIEGNCVDMPNEPPESNFKHKIRHTSYPCVERGGVVWAYMGSKSPHRLPDLEWTTLPDNQRFHAKRVQNCNWVQALEGDIDQSHVSFLHRRLDQVPDLPKSKQNVDRIRSKDTHPRFEVHETDGGVLIGAGRDAGNNTMYWRVTQFLLPFWSMTGPYGENPTRHTRAWVPMDDEHTMLFSITFHPLRPLDDEEVAKMRMGSGAGYVGDGNFLPSTSAPGGAWRPKAGKDNSYFWSQELQRTKFFSGIPEFWAQDAAMQEGMGPIYDRTKEHLGTSDLGIIRVRQRLLDAARALCDRGVAPPGAMEPAVYRVRGAAALVSRDASWVEATEEKRMAIPGTNPAGV